MQHDIIIFLVGIVVGAMNSIAGGGMLIGFPVLLALGVPSLIANATGHVAASSGLITATLGNREYLRKIPRRYAILVLPLLIGSVAGSFYLRNTPADTFEQIVPSLLFFGVGLFAFQPLLHFHLHRHLRGHTSRLWPVLLVAFALLPISFYGGYFGIGFGFLMLAFLGFTSVHDAHMMNALKNVAAVVVGLTAIICLLGSGLIDWHVGIVMGAGTALGGYVGARLSQKLNSHWLRIAIVVIGLAAAIRFWYTTR